jgi:hypothetical protein
MIHKFSGDKIDSVFVSCMHIRIGMQSNLSSTLTSDW